MPANKGEETRSELVGYRETRCRGCERVEQRAHLATRTGGFEKGASCETTIEPLKNDGR